MNLQIHLNHLGYEPRSVKRAILQGSRGAADPGRELDFLVKDSEKGTVELRAKARYCGPIAHWKDWLFWTLDFSELAKVGRFVIEMPGAASGLRSEPFEIAEDLLVRRTVPAVLKYFRSQRCTGILDEADRNLGFFGPRGDRVDVHGGWYDASGDKGKYLSHLSYANFMNPQQTPLAVWSLLEARELLGRDAGGSPSPAAAAGQSTGAELLEEAAYGADFLVRMQDPVGYFYMTVFDGWTADPEQREICSYRTQTGERSDDYQAGYRQGGGLAIAALARMSTLGAAGKFGPEEYLGAAIRGFEHLERHNTEYLDDGRENIIDDYCALLAAAELYNAAQVHGTADPELFLNAARGRAARLIARLDGDERCGGWWSADERGGRPYFHAAEAGLPAVSLLRYFDLEPDQSRRRSALRAVRRSLDFELAVTTEVNNPFGYARQYVCSPAAARRSAFFLPHANESGYWWQGENARLASLAAASRKAAALFREDPQLPHRLESYALDQLNWILGCNPFDACMLHGFGRNNPEYEGGFPNAYGGICNGITAGIADEEDIDFLPDPYARQGEHRWRWSEQWLPHAAWYLLAVCAG
jgi:hypothetical protein